MSADNIVPFKRHGHNVAKLREAKARLAAEEQQWRCDCGGLVFLLMEGGEIRCGTCAFTSARRHFDPREP